MDEEDRRLRESVRGDVSTTKIRNLVTKSWGRRVVYL